MRLSLNRAGRRGMPGELGGAPEQDIQSQGPRASLAVGFTWNIPRAHQGPGIPRLRAPWWPGGWTSTRSCLILCWVIFFFLINSNLLFIYLFLYLFLAVLGLRFCARAYLQLWRVGTTLHRGARASHCRGLSCCGAQAPDAQAQ